MLNYVYDAEEIPFNSDEVIVVATDNSGSIGMKALDDVRVNYETVSYYTFRVAYMECLAAGGQPFSIIMHNFNDATVWEELITGINKGLTEVGLKGLPITGSTETNFKLTQSALGLVILGKKKGTKKVSDNFTAKEYAIIGKPLVGEELIQEENQIAPLSLYKELSELKGVDLIYPIGSKGIKYEIDRQINHKLIYPDALDIYKSSGPGTSFLIVYNSNISELVKCKAGSYLQMTQSLHQG